ncbi:MAG: hypothetical protein K6U88_00085, partial [Dehalococcoidia bacterium]|nr:hypothetical protein [Dehalococcoidia bacterium]
LEPHKKTHEAIQQAKELARQEQDLLSFAEATQEIKAVTISELLNLFPEGKAVEPKPSSWSTSGQDLEAGNPYPLWLDPGNEIHTLQWEHLNICIDMVGRALAWADNDTSKYYAGIARGLLDRASHSCQFWWASRRPMWSIPMIYRGFLLLNQVATYAAHAIVVGDASEPVKREARWRLAAANETRLELERELIGSRAP